MICLAEAMMWLFRKKYAQFYTFAKEVQELLNIDCGFNSYCKLNRLICNLLNENPIP